MKSKKLFSSLLISLALVLFPSIVKADEVKVAKIGEIGYNTIDEAIAAANKGDTIELLADVTATKTFYKSLTFTGGHTLYMDVYGWRYNGDLVFDGANLSINSGESSRVANNGEAGKWFTMVLSGSITARNGANITFTFDSKYGVNCAIYTGSRGVTINVEDNSKFRIYGKNTKGVTGQGIQLDSTANTGIFVTNGSEFLIDGTNRGYVNSPTIYVDDSTFTVQNCTSNASNGGAFTAIKSKIYFLNNTGHGLSATTLDIQQSSNVFTNGNGYYGITVGSKLTVDSTSTIESNENGWGYPGGALRLASSTTTGTIASGANVILENNLRNALENYGTLTFEEGVVLSITGNYEPNNGAGIYNGSKGKIILPENAVIMNNTAGATGGGVRNNGTIVIPNSVKLYNNHALTAGDDIYNNGTITFGAVGEDWFLDEGTRLYDSLISETDCNDRINGWYEDGYEKYEMEDGLYTYRWEAHDDTSVNNHIVLVSSGESITTPFAVKAAHDRGTVVIKYVDEEGNEIVDSVMLNPGISGDTFETSALDLTNKNYQFDKYVYETDLENTDYKITTKVDEVTGNNIETGEYIFGNVTITYMYYKVGYLEVHFVDEEGNKISATEKFTEKIGSDYQTYPNQIPDYELINHEGEETGKYIDGTIQVTYIYTFIGGTGDVEDPDIIVPPHTDAEISVNANALMFIVEAEDKKRRN